MSEVLQHRADAEKKSLETVEDLLHSGDFEELTRLVQQENWSTNERKQLLILIVTVVSPSIDPKNYSKTIAALFQSTDEDFNTPTSRDNDASLMKSNLQKSDDFALNIIKLALLMEACGQVYYSLKFVDYCLSSIPEAYFVSEDVSQVALATRSDLTEISGTEEERAMLHFIAMQELFVHLSVFCRLFSKELIDVSTSLFDWILLSKKQKVIYHLQLLFSRVKSEDRLTQSLGQLLQKELFEMFDSDLPLNSFLSKNLFLQVLREAEAIGVSQGPSEGFALLTEHRALAQDEEEEDTEHVILQAISDLCPSLNHEQICAILRVIEERFATVTGNEEVEEEVEGEVTSAPSLHFSEEFYVKLLLLVITRIDQMDPILSLLRSILSLIFSQVTRPLSELLLLCLYELERISVVVAALSGRLTVPPLAVLAPQWIKEAIQHLNLQDTQRHFNLRRCLMTQAMFKENHFKQTRDLIDVMSRSMRLHRFLDLLSVSEGEQYLSGEEEEEGGAALSCYDYSIEEILLFSLSRATVKLSESDKEKDESVETISTKAEQLVIGYLRNVYELFSANERTVRLEQVRYAVFEVLRRILPDALWKEIVSLGLFGRPTGSSSTSSSDCKIFEWMEKLFPDLSNIHFAVFVASAFFCGKELYSSGGVSLEQPIYYLNLLRIANFENNDDVAATANLKAFLHIEFYAHNLKQSVSEQLSPSLYDGLFSEVFKREREASSSSLVRQEGWLEKYFDDFVKRLEEISCDVANIAQAKNLFQLIVSSSSSDEEDFFDVESQYSFPGFNFFQSFLAVYHRRLLNDSLEDRHSFSRKTTLLDEMLSDLARFSGRFVLVLFRIASHLREFRVCLDLCDYFFRHSALFTTVKVETAMIEEIFRFRDLISDNYHYSGDALSLTQRCLCSLSDDRMMKYFDKLLLHPRQSTISGSDGEDLGSRAARILDKLVTSGQGSAIDSILDLGFRQNLEEDETHLTLVALMQLASKAKESSHRRAFESLSTGIRHALDSQSNKVKEELAGVRSVLNVSVHFQNELEIDQINETYVNKLVKSGFSVSGAKKAVYETRKVGTFEASLQFAITHNQDEGFDNPIVLGEKKNEGLILSSSRSRTLESLQKQERLNRMLSMIRRISERLFPSDSKTFMELPVISIAETSLPFVKEENQEIRRSARLKSVLQEDVDEEQSNMPCTASISFEGVTHDALEEDKNGGNHTIDEITRSRSASIEDKAANRDSDVEEISGESSRRSETDMLDSSNVATAPDTPNLPISVEVGNELISHQSVRDVLSPKLRGLHQQLALSVELQAFLDHFFVLGDDGRTLFAVENFHILINKVIHSTSDEASFFNLIDDALPFIIEFFESNKSCDDIERLAELLLKEKEVDSFISSLTRLRDEAPPLALLSRDFLCFLEADETRKLDEDKLLSKRERIISICFLSRWVFLVRNEEANLLHHFTADFQLRFFRRFPFLYSQLLSLHYETIRATDYVSILWVKERLADLIEVSGLWEVFLHSVFPQLLQLLHPSVIATSLLESAALLDLWQTLLQEECQVLKRLEKIYGAAISGSNDIGMVFNAKAFIQSETFLPPRYFPLQSNRAASNKEFLSRRKFTGLREIFYQMPSEETALLSLLPQIHRYFSKYLSLQSVSDLFFLAILRQLDHRINHDSDEEDTFSFFDDSLLEKLSSVHVRILSYLIADWPLEKLHLYDQTIEQGAVITSPSFEEEPTPPVSQLLCLPHCDQIRRKFHEHITYASKRQLLLRLEQHSIRHSSQQTKSKIKKIGAATPAFDVSTDSGHESFISHLLIPFCRILEEVENLSQPKEVLLDFFATSFDAIPSSKEKCGAIFLWPHCDSDELRALERRFLPRFKGGSDEAVILDDVRSVEVLSSFYRWFFAFQDDLCRSVATLSPTTGLEELVLTLSRDSFDELLTSFHGCDDAEQRENCGENFARFMLVLSRGKSFVRSSNNPAKSSFDELIVEFLEAIWKETICKCPLTSHSVAGRLIPGMDGSNSESEGMLSQSEFFYLLNRKFLYFAWDTVAEQSVIRTIGAALDDFHYLIRLLQLAHISFFKKFLSINYDGSGESSQWRVQWQDSDSSSELLLSTEAFILHLVTCTVSNSSLHGHSAEFYHWLLIYMRKLLVSSSFHPSSPINSTVQHYASTSLRLQLLRFFYDVEVSPLLTDLLRSDSLETVKSSWLSFLQILLKNCQWSVLSDALSVDFPLLFKIQKESSSDALYQRSQELLSDILKSDDMTSSSKMNDDSSVEITRLLALWLSSLTGASEELVGRLEDIALRIEGTDDVGKLQVLSYHLFPTYVHTLIPRLLILSEPKEGRNVLFRLLLRHSFPVIDAFPSGPLLKIQQQSGNNQESLDERLQNAEGSKLWPEPLDLVCVILLQGYVLEAVYLNWFLQRLPKVCFSQSQGALLLRQGVARNKQLILSLECDLNSSSAEKLLSSERRRLFDRALDCLRQFN